MDFAAICTFEAIENEADILGMLIPVTAAGVAGGNSTRCNVCPVAA